MAIAIRRAVRTTTTSTFVALVVALGVSSVARADRLVSVVEVAHGYYAPRFAPDGRSLLITGPKLRGLYTASVTGGAVHQLSNDVAAGVHAHFLPDGSIAYRALRAGAHRDLVIDQSGAVRSAPAALTTSTAMARDDEMFVRDGAGHWRQVGSGDRFFAPVVSPDGDRVAFEGLATGIYVYQISTDTLVHVGDGTAPAWSPDGRRLAFELTEDDGHQIVASDLYLYDVGSRVTQRLTATDNRLERRPSFSPDGSRIAFDDDQGTVLIGTLAGGN